MTKDEAEKAINESRNAYERTRAASEYVLAKRDNVGPAPEETMSGRDLMQAVRQEFGHIEGIARIPENSFFSYLSRASTDAASRITSHGVWQGYYLQTQEQANERAADSVEPSQEESRDQNQRQQREAALYPMLRDWLDEQGYRAKDIADTRILGVWGNPDIGGIKVADLFGTRSIEIATIEAKIKIGGWETEIFQAISHRRYANRAYFAYAIDESQKIYPEMKYYAELYGVGVLQIVFTNEDYLTLTSGTLVPYNDLVGIVREIFPAKHRNVPQDYQKRFLDAVGVVDEASLYTF